MFSHVYIVQNWLVKKDIRLLARDDSALINRLWIYSLILQVHKKYTGKYVYNVARVEAACLYICVGKKLMQLEYQWRYQLATVPIKGYEYH